MLIVILAVLLSFVILCISFVKKYKTQTSSWFPPNEELEKFYELEGSASQQQKQLVAAASVTASQINELENERRNLYTLSQERITSMDLWNTLDNTVKEMEIEKMIVQNEADKLKNDWGTNIWKEVDLRETGKQGMLKKRDIDGLFWKKKETLEKRLVEKLKV